LLDTIETVTDPQSQVSLISEQETTLSTPRLKSGIGAKLLFMTMDLVYGKKGSLSKFRVLEVIARVPYIAWEQVSYIAITHTHSSPAFAREIHEEVSSFRQQQDNELFHLLILEELLQKNNKRQGFWRYRVIPQILAYMYYHISWLLYVIRPRWSYNLNAQFEDHAEHEYMLYVAEHPELETQKWDSDFSKDYGEFDSVADLIRQIAVDERHHRHESLERVEQARFGTKNKST